MTVRAKRVSGPSDPCRSRSWFRVHPGEGTELTFRLTDGNRRQVDWSGHELRFRVYSQFVDRKVVLEITDPAACELKEDGIWRLRLTPQQTASLPNGGMRFTLEHREAGGEFVLGLLGSVSSQAIPSQAVPSKADRQLQAAN